MNTIVTVSPHYQFRPADGFSDASKTCNITGLWCLHLHASQLTTLKPHWEENRAGLVCECLPSCDETEITVIKDVVTPAS
ncbi:unnamed protein product [Leptosia nina]|uniref:Uncharacterized protein n=1 Tax=Leptosia nina TaxID=320188 RepID=A0AAV1JQB0_9NEOP